MKADEAIVEEMLDGKFKVTLAVKAAKFEADSEGCLLYTEFTDMIDIGVFTANPDNNDFGVSNVLYMQKHKVTKDTKSIELIVDAKPMFAGIDPYNKLIDRNSNDNIKAVTDAEGENAD